MAFLVIHILGILIMIVVVATAEMGPPWALWVFRIHRAVSDVDFPLRRVILV